jgi:hypothetical protein
VDAYRLEELDDVWGRLADEAWAHVPASNIPYRLAALRVVACRARATEGELRTYMTEHEWSARVNELHEVCLRLANIRHAARAAYAALANRMSRYVPPWPSADAPGGALDWREDAWLELRGWSVASEPRMEGPD